MSQDSKVNEYDLTRIREAVYGDSLSASTEKSGRSLLAVALVAIIVAVYDVQVTSSLLLPVSFEKNPEALVTFLAVSTIVLMINYALRLSNDLLRTREQWIEVTRHLVHEKLARERRSAEDTEDNINRSDPNRPDSGWPDPWWEGYIEQAERAKIKLRELDERLGQRGPQITLMWVRLSVFGGLPILVAMLAMLHTWRNAMAFVCAALGI